MPNASIRVEGLSKLEQIPGWLDDGQRQFVERISHRLADQMQLESPKSHIPFTARVLDSNSAKIESTHPGAKALDKGAYISGKGHKLKFQVDGRLVFAKFVRLAARNYTKKALRQRNKITADEYQKAFGELGR
jgi:hypothetical protein